MSSTMWLPEPKVLVDGLAYVESPRWHEGRLWFGHWGTGEIVAVNTDGDSEVVGHGPPKVNASVPGHSLGWSIDWLPNGRLLITGKELVRREPDGSMVRHADLSDIASFGWNEIVVDGRGNVYVNSIRFGFVAGELPTSGIIALVSPDGSARKPLQGLSDSALLYSLPTGPARPGTRREPGRLIDGLADKVRHQPWEEALDGP